MGSGCSSLVNKPTAVDPIKHAVFSPGSPNVGEVGPGSSKPGDPGLPAGILFIRYREPKHMEEVAQAAARTLEGAEMAFGATALVIRDDYSAKALKSQEASSQEGELGDPGSVATPRETSGSKGRSSVAHPNLRGLEVLDELVAKRSVKDICIAESEPCIQLVPSEDQELLIPSPMKQNKCRSLPGKGGGGIYPAESNGVKFLYKIGKTLGTGAFSTVKLATNRETGEKHAVKIMKVGDLDGQTSLEGARLEVQLLQDAAHANVIQLIECFEEGHKVYIVSELLAGNARRISLGCDNVGISSSVVVSLFA